MAKRIAFVVMVFNLKNTHLMLTTLQPICSSQSSKLSLGKYLKTKMKSQ